MMFTFYIAGCNVFFHFRNKPRVNLVFPPWGKVTGCAVSLSGEYECQMVHLPTCRGSLLPLPLVTEYFMTPQCLHHGLFSKSRGWGRYLGLGKRIKCGFIICILHRIFRWRIKSKVAYLNRNTFFTSVSSFKENLSGFFPWDLPVVKISPEWVTGPEQGKSSGRIGTFSLWTGKFRDGISPIPDETVIPLWLCRHFLVCENGVYRVKVRMTVG